MDKERTLSVQINATQLRQGMIIVHQGTLHRVVEMQHVTPGNWRGFVQTKLQNLETGAHLNHRFRSEDQVEKAVLESREMQYLYHDGPLYHFMDSETFEQRALGADLLEGATGYLVPNVVIQVTFFKGNPVGVELPTTVDLRIVETEPPLKGATATGSPKPATLETGMEIKVPPYIERGTVVRIDTRDGSFVEKVS